MCDMLVRVLFWLILCVSIAGICFSLGKDFGKFLVQVFEWVVDCVCPVGGRECFKTTALLFWGSVLVAGFFLLRAIRRLYC